MKKEFKTMLSSHLTTIGIVFNPFIGDLRFSGGWLSDKVICYVGNNYKGVKYYNLIKQALNGLPKELRKQFKLIKRTRHSDRKSVLKRKYSKFAENYVNTDSAEYFAVYLRQNPDYDKSHFNAKLLPIEITPIKKPNLPNNISLPYGYDWIMKNYVHILYMEQYIHKYVCDHVINS